MDQKLDFHGQTVIHPVALGFTLLMGVLVLVLPRRFVVYPMILVTCFIPVNQRIVVATLDFNMLRILVLFGWTRLLLMGEHRSFRLNIIDTAIICLVLSRMVIYSIHWATREAFIFQLGQAFDAVGMYFLFRFLIRDFDDIDRVIKALAVVSVPLAISMMIENITGRNAFSVFGGVPEITLMREGRLRCQGAFAHPIMAGSFGATLFPVVVSLWWESGTNKGLALLGGISTTIVTIISASTGPLLAYGCSVAGLGMWSCRKFLRVLWLMALVSFLGLYMYMRDPILSLIGRLQLVGGSTANHRYALIDAAISRFDEWWLWGIKSTSHWGWGLWDLTNQYILEGVRGGLLTLVLFVSVIVLCFRGLGRAMRAIEEEPTVRTYVWPLGVSLFATAVSFAGVSYFGQMLMVWHLQLALISSVSSSAEQVSRATLPAYHYS
jgi:hypothetical protein